MQTNFFVKTRLEKIVLFLFVVVLVLPSVACATDGVNYSGGTVNNSADLSGGVSVEKLSNPLNNIDSVGAIVNVATKYFTYLAILCAVLALIWVGFQFVLAQGKPDKLKETSKWLSYIMIGVAIILGARLMIMIVLNTLGATGAIDKNVTSQATQALNGK